MKDRKERKHDTMHQSDFISDPFFDLLKEQLDESLELENIRVSEDLIQSTLKAIDFSKETKSHQDDSVSALEGKEPVSIETRRREKIENTEKEISARKTEQIETEKTEEEKCITEQAQKVKTIKKTHKRKDFWYIGAWGSIVAASILLFYFASQDIFPRITREDRTTTSGMNQSAESAVPESIENSDGAYLDRKQDTMDSDSGVGLNAKEPSATLRNDSALLSEESDSEEAKAEEKESYSIATDKNSTLSKDDLEDITENTIEDETLSSQQAQTQTTQADSTNGITAQGKEEVVNGRAMEDALREINTRATKATTVVNLDENSEEKSKEIMLLMTSEELHLMLEEPSKELSYIICVQIAQENVIVYFINDTEVLIQSYGAEGLITSTSYEVATSFELVSKVEKVLK